MRSAEVIFILSMISLTSISKEFSNENRDLFELFNDSQPQAIDQINLEERSRSQRLLQEEEEGEGESTFDPGFLTTDEITDAKTCLRDCISAGDYFCRKFDVFDQGICCLKDDPGCVNGDYDLCSNQFAGMGREIFTCPFESSRCGS